MNRARCELTRLKCKWTRKLKGKGVDETSIYLLALTKAKIINITRGSSNGKKIPIANGKKNAISSFAII